MRHAEPLFDYDMRYPVHHSKGRDNFAATGPPGLAASASAVKYGGRFSGRALARICTRADHEGLLGRVDGRDATNHPMITAATQFCCTSKPG
jgi:hypothetical protein